MQVKWHSASFLTLRCFVAWVLPEHPPRVELREPEVDVRRPSMVDPALDHPFSACLRFSL